ncbi:6-hydroxymethylpterin diphosphokinase MptE-like protein [Methanobacterium alcaliphilum]|uniref:6-hydroxymethylpterin diphosphokinase MptE-like protein n=1 Tax=Methanobacterium alcaliphilum TaxID=392018 RepID=UPI00200B1D9A|nr:6-hydroxymethylpterin diphosphokinase MptE-like protein [Methanobacterium alcaliphilum]MCK9152576.1 DUF115 domain-containing protein [Methanobacterium alcaliphilum]
MEIEEWLLWYDIIIQDFGFSKKDDDESALYLNNFLMKQGLLELSEFPSKKDMIVFGAGPSLKKHIKNLKSTLKHDLDEFILISADGATTALLEENIIPNIIVTDLDGNMQDIQYANERGSYLVVHAHGNNLNTLKRYLPNLKNILGTTQGTTLECVHNFGGFTDGDRSVFLAVELGAENIILAGMDFGNIVTKYSRPDMDQETGHGDEIKVKKLKYAEELVEWIIENENVTIYNLIHEYPEKYLKLRIYNE